MAGLGGTVFLFMALVRGAFLWIIQYEDPSTEEVIFPSYLGGFIILVFSSLAFAFYLRYVGSVDITFNTMIKVILIGLFSPVALGIADELKDLRQQNKSLILKKEFVQLQIKKIEVEYLYKSIDHISENNTENLSMLISNIALIKSADNYVEIVFMEDKHLKKKLMRGFTGNIGFHHVYHLSPKISNYNLARCKYENDLFNDVKPITLISTFKSLRISF